MREVAGPACRREFSAVHRKPCYPTFSRVRLPSHSLFLSLSFRAQRGISFLPNRPAYTTAARVNRPPPGLHPLIRSYSRAFPLARGPPAASPVSHTLPPRPSALSLPPSLREGDRRKAVVGVPSASIFLLPARDTIIQSKTLAERRISYQPFSHVCIPTGPAPPACRRASSRQGRRPFIPLL